MLRVLRKIISIFFPENCRLCGSITSEKKYLCPSCTSQICFISEPHCTVCGIPFQGETHSHPCARCLKNAPEFSWHRSRTVYSDQVAHLVHGLKYGAKLDVLNLLGDWLMHYQYLLEGSDFLIPVPLSIDRLRGRTYNQSLELARNLSRRMGIPVLAQGLQKNKVTPPQTTLARAERLQNLKGAFIWTGNQNLEGKKVVLIDDICTTGSTLSECARTLQLQNPREVGALTIALTPFN